MGLYDLENLFANDQAITTTGASTNVVDVGKNRGGGLPPVRLQLQVTTAFTAAEATTDTLAFAVQSCTTEGFGTTTTEFTSTAMLQAALTAGKKVLDVVLPAVHGRYLRLYYTKSGSAFTAGNVFGGLLLDGFTNDYSVASDTDTGLR